MATCIVCKETNAEMIDGVCEKCEPVWLDKMANFAKGLSRNAQLSELFARTNAAFLPKSTDGPIKIYRYKYGQNVDYIYLGEFVEEIVDCKKYHSVICTLEPGEAGMQHIGIYTICVHQEAAAATSYTLTNDEARKHVSSGILSYTVHGANVAQTLAVKARFLENLPIT